MNQLENLNIPVSTKDIINYTLTSACVLGAQQLVKKTLPDKKPGFKYWIKITCATMLGVFSGGLLTNFVESYQKPTVVKRSSATNSAKAKESDTSSL